MVPPGVVRCFVAIDLAAGVRAAIAAVTSALAAGGGDVRWVTAQNLHVTLKFLGNVPEADVGALRVALGPVAARVAPFTIRVAGLGFFPGSRRARVIWVGLDGPALGVVAAGVDEALGVLGFPREARPFAPHVTIGRVRSQHGWEEQLDRVRMHASAEFGVSPVEEIVVYRSDLGPQGARYAAIDRLELGGALQRNPH